MMIVISFLSTILVLALCESISERYQPGEAVILTLLMQGSRREATYLTSFSQPSTGFRLERSFLLLRPLWPRLAIFDS